MNIKSKFHRLLLNTGALAFVAASSSMVTVQAGELNLLTWVSYADESFTKDWQERTGCKLNPTLVGSNDEIISKIAAGDGTYDLVSPSIDTTTILWKLGKIQALDVSKLKYLDDVYPNLRANSGATLKDGTVIGQPNSWGSIPMMYRTDKVSETLDSMSVIFDEKYAGKISLWDDKSNIYMVARYLFGVETNVFDLNDEQLAAVQAKLIEQKKNIRAYWTQAGDHINLMASGEAWISNTWGGYQSAELLAKDIPMVEYLPKEKADGWMDAWQITTDARDMDCAYQWINFAASPEGQCAMSLFSGFSAASSKVDSCMTPEEFTTRHQDDPGYIDSLVLWQEPARPAAYIEVWNAVKAAP
jgi:spermidine/putrescine-binding protein